MISRTSFYVLLAMLAGTSAGMADAATPLVNPVTINLGGPTVHLTPHGYDSTGAEVPVSIAQCRILGIPTTIATVSYDATGAVLTAVGTGAVSIVQWQCTNGSASVLSGVFTVSVPWNVTAVGDTMP